MKSDDHIDRQIVPKLNLSTTFHIEIMDNISLVSNWHFVSQREALNIEPIPMTTNWPYLLNYVILPSYVNTNISLKYGLNDITFSLDFKNIFNQTLNFFDGYFNDDGFKLSAGFFYKF